MERPSVAAMVLAVGAVALSAACGDGAATPPREINVGDLATMVLQREDVPAGLRLLEEGGPEGRGVVEPMYDPRAEAMFLREFERPRDEAAPGTVVCITNSVLLYETPHDAAETFQEAEELSKIFEKESQMDETDTAWSEIDRASLPQLGDQLKVIRFVSPNQTFCSSYENEPAEGFMIVFLRRNVAAGLFMYAYERGASLEEAIELAQKQASRIEDVFEGESRD